MLCVAHPTRVCFRYMDPGADLPQPGDVLSDKYTVVRSISVGGMGVVYEALHNRIGSGSP